MWLRLISLAPIPRPRRNIFCVGNNYRDHAREFSQSGFDASAQSADEIPDVPIIFNKTLETVIGTGTDILYPEGIRSAIDYEAELAVVIGKEGR
jgi:2-keto-4-pentenoate hydratase/2-oxohepta-3-ene-1,7-dioic acid hydratase in catechol pathway